MVKQKVERITVNDPDGSCYALPYLEIDSGVAGPAVLITAALHGTELNGCEIIRRITPKLRRSLQRGRCWLLPFANLAAIRRHQPHIEYEIGKKYGSDKTNNINCTWPGNAQGSRAQRASAAIKATLVDRATHNIDLHSWHHTLATAVLARTGYTPSLELAKATGLRFARHSDWMPEVKQRPATPCTLTSYFNDTGRAAVCIEFSGQNFINHAEIPAGMRAVLNCLRFLDMLPETPEPGDTPQIWINDAKTTEVKAPCSGLFLQVGRRLGAPIREGALLGWIYNDNTLKSYPIRAPAAGYLYRYGCLRTDAHDRGDHHAAAHPYATEQEPLAVILTP